MLLSKNILKCILKKHGTDKSHIDIKNDNHYYRDTILTIDNVDDNNYKNSTNDNLAIFYRKSLCIRLSAKYREQASMPT